jgi:hypothetical protein
MSYDKFDAKKEYYHLSIKKEDVCNYFKECPIENNINGSLCHLCKYHHDVDVPRLLAERGRE